MDKTELKELLTNVFKEKGVSDIILEYLKDLHLTELNDMRIELFDMRFSRKMPFYTRDDLSNIWMEAKDLLAKDNGLKYNIHNIYQRIDNIENEIEKMKQIELMKLKIENKQKEYLSFFG